MATFGSDRSSRRRRRRYAAPAPASPNPLGHADQRPSWHSSRPHLSFVRKVLYSLMVITGLASTISAGTFASFNASTTNSSTFATGTLVLNRQVAVTACLSVGAGTSTDAPNYNAACGAIINAANVKTNDAATAVDLTIENKGSLSGNVFLAALDADPGTGGVQACLSSNNASAYWQAGTGNLCTNASLVIQEYTDSGRGTAMTSCAFPYSAVGSCVLGGPLGTASQLPTTPLDLGTVSGATSRWFRVFMRLPNTLDDQYQGRRASFTLAWTLQ